MKQFSYDGLPQWQLDIIHKYPDIYLEPNPYVIECYKDCRENLDTEKFCNLRFGFEFDEGWKKLVDEFSYYTSNYIKEIKKSGIQSDAYVKSLIFKEKFGILTWQGTDNLIEPFNKIWRGYCHHIEIQSGYICEKTGKRGSMRTINGSLLKVLSDEEYLKCSKQKFYKYEPESLVDFE